MASEVKTAISLEDRISPAVAKMNRALASTEDQMSKVDSASDRVGKNSGFESMGASIDGASGKSSGFAAKIGLISGVVQSVTSSAMNAFSGLAGDIVEASDSAQKFAQTLKFAGLGDAEIQKLTASTQKYADQTIYSISDIRNITSQLASNGVKGYSSLAEAAGNLNAVAGGNANTFKSVGMVLTQTAGAGKLTTENWNQLADAIPGASGILQKAMLKNGAYTGNFRDAMAKGEITADEFNKAIQDVGMTDVAKQAATSTSTIEGSLGNMQAAAAGAGAKLLDLVKPEITGFMNNLGNAISFLGDHLNVVIPLVVSLGTAYAVLKTASVVSSVMQLASAAGGLIPLLIGWASSLDVVTGAQALWNGITKIGMAVQMAFNAVMAINPFVLIIAAIAIVVAALVWFFTQTKVGQQAWQTFTSWLSGLWTGFVSFAQGVWNGFAAFWSGLWTAVSSAFSAIWTALVAFFSPIIQGIYTVIYDIIIVIAAIWVTIWNGISTVFTAVWNGIVAFFTPIINAISNTIATVITAILSVWQAVWGAISGFFTNVWNGMVNFFTPIINNISNTISNVINSIRNTWNSVWGAISGFFSGIWSGMVDAVGNAVNSIGGAVGRIWGVVMGPLSDAGSWLVDVGHNIISGLIGGITGAFGWLKNTISNLGSSVVGWAKGVLGIHSPSKVFKNEVGKMIGLGLGDGIAASTGYVTDKMDAMITAATPKIPSPTFSTSTTGGGLDANGGGKIDSRSQWPGSYPTNPTVPTSPSGGGAAAGAGIVIQITNHYPQAEPTSETVQRALDAAAALGQGV